VGKYQHIEVNVKGIGEEDLYISNEQEDKEAIKIAALKSMRILDKINAIGFVTSCGHVARIHIKILPERNEYNPKVMVEYCCTDAHLEIMTFLSANNW
jgi:hypothetical protein